jgi:hypothetical protein
VLSGLDDLKEIRRHSERRFRKNLSMRPQTIPLVSSEIRKNQYSFGDFLVKGGTDSPWGVWVEDTVLVRLEGPKVLTAFLRHLIRNSHSIAGMTFTIVFFSSRERYPVEADAAQSNWTYRRRLIEQSYLRRTSMELPCCKSALQKVCRNCRR